MDVLFTHPLETFTLCHHQVKNWSLQQEYLLLLAFEGEGEIRFAGHLDDVEPHNVLLCAPGREITLACQSYEEMKVAALRLAPGALFGFQRDRQVAELLNGLLNRAPPLKKIQFSAREFEQIRHYFSLLYSEQKTTRPLSLRICTLVLEGLLVSIAREYQCQHAAQPGSPAAQMLGVVEQVKQAIYTRYSEPLSLTALAAEYRLTPQYLSGLFKQKCGIGFADFVAGVRIDNAKKMLLDSEDLVVQIAEANGFNSNTHFGYTFRKYTGFTPLEYRKRFRAGQ